VCSSDLLYTLHAGIRRNFRYVKDVRLFIEGNEAYYERFRALFRADSGEAAPDEPQPDTESLIEL
jgi:hypothetical protein